MHGNTYFRVYIPECLISSWSCSQFNNNSVVFLSSQGDLDMFLTLSLPDPPTFYPSIRPDVQSEIEEKIDLESFIKPR